MDVDLYKTTNEHIGQDIQCEPMRSAICDTCIFNNIVGISKHKISLISKIAKILNKDEPVMIIGEAGTGKRIVSRVIHYSTCSKRNKEPLIYKDCRHIKLSFFDNIARELNKYENSNPTLFLYGLDELSTDAEIELLKLTEEKGQTLPNFRIISTVLPSIYAKLRNDSFRKELFYRLNTFNLFLSPLRELKQDILPLTFHFLDKIAKKNNVKYYHITRQVMQSIMDYDWPGNVQELKNFLFEEVTYLKDNKVVIDSAADNILYRKQYDRKQSGHTGLHKHDELSIQDNSFRITQFPNSLVEVEKDFILLTLKFCGGNRNKASRLLKVSRNTLYRKLEQYQKKYDSAS